MLFDKLEKSVDLIIDCDLEPGIEVSTILDFTQERPELVRQGLGWQEAEEWLNLVP